MRNFRQIGVAAVAVAMSACASQGMRGAGYEGIPAANLPENISPPGEYKTGLEQTDLMYVAMLADVAAQRGQLQVALDYYHFVAMRTKDVYFAERTARIGNYVRAFEKALDGALLWQAAVPDDAEAAQLVAILYLRTGQYGPARAELEKILRDTEDQRLGQAFLQLGALFQREVPLNQAMEMMNFLLEQHTELPEALYVASTLSLGLDEKEKALKWINEVVKLAPDWEEGALLRLRILFSLNRKDEAIRHLAKYLDRYPKKSTARLAYARALIEANKLKEARSQYELLLVKMPENEEVLYSLAMLSIQFKDYTEAEGYLGQLEKGGKRGDQVKYYLGQIAEQRGEDEKALDWYASVAEGEFYLDAQLRMAVVLARAKSLDEAIEHLHAIPLENAEEKRTRLLFEGDLLRRNFAYKQSYAVYKKALKEYPDDIDLLYGRALVAERLDKINEALKTLEEIVSRQPDNVPAINAIGYTLIDRTDRLQEGKEYLEKAYSMEPDDPAIIDSMGWMYYRMANYPKALEFLKKASEMIEDGEVMAHYGEVLWMAGQQDKARAVWNKALEQFADNLVLQETVKRFIKE